MLNKLCFWKRKRYWYAVFFSYNDGDRHDTSWIFHSEFNPVNNSTRIRNIQRMVEESEGFVYLHAKKPEHMTNIRFVSIMPMGWDRIK